MSDLNRLMGGSPGPVVVKLVFLSLLVGAFMAFLDVTPLALIEGLVSWFRSIFDMSFETVRDLAVWTLYGAMVVLPLWLLSRLFGRR